MFSPHAFIEMFVVVAFGVAWFILELVCKRLDRMRESEDSGAKSGQNPEAKLEE